MKVLVIVGPTGVGKSDLGIDLAKQFNGEIISGDSVQIYKELNIGSAKVSKHERKEVVHHLVDEYELTENYDVTIFQKEARRLIEDISNRGKLPIIVGGTGLYISAVLKNYIFLEEEKDEELEAYLESKTNEELYAELKELDPKSAEVLHVNNRIRLIRALTIAKSQDVKKSDLVKKQDETLLYDAHIISLTMDRDLLYERINERVLLMDKLGLEKELQGIVKKYDNPFELRGMFGIGYKEWRPYFEEGVSKDKILKEIQKRSRNYAKRQFTWFRNQFEATWFDVLDENFTDEIYTSVSGWLEDKED